MGETGRYPLFIKCFKQMINFWLHVKNADPNSLAHKAFVVDTDMANDNKESWGLGVKRILEHFGEGRVWSDNDQINHKSYPRIFEKAMRRNYDIFWQHKVRLSSLTNGKLGNYGNFKKSNTEEPYLSLPFKYRKYLSRFRSSSHKLRIETGRYLKPLLIREDRICKYCTLGSLENEEHFLLVCPYYKFERHEFFGLINNYIDLSIWQTDNMILPDTYEGKYLILLNNILQSVQMEVMVALAKLVLLACNRSEEAIINGWAF